MNDILNRWMGDAEAFELQKLYRVNTNQEYEFTTRQGDFYITLLNRMYNILQGTKHAENETRTEELDKDGTPLWTFKLPDNLYTYRVYKYR